MKKFFNVCKDLRIGAFVYAFRDPGKNPVIVRLCTPLLKLLYEILTLILFRKNMNSLKEAAQTQSVPSGAYDLGSRLAFCFNPKLVTHWACFLAQ